PVHPLWRWSPLRSMEAMPFGHPLWRRRLRRSTETTLSGARGGHSRVYPLGIVTLDRGGVLPWLGATITRSSKGLSGAQKFGASLRAWRGSEAQSLPRKFGG
ncbi:hypothetical protein E2562_003738, partial [Oryza meyeriana var. granulata]